MHTTDMNLLSPLLPSREDATALLGNLVEQLDEIWRALPTMMVGPAWDAEARSCWLSRFDFENPVPLDELLPDTTGALANGILLSQHPRCFGLFNPAPAFPGVAADLITAALNPQLAVHSHAPLAVEIENRVIQAVAERIWPHDRVGGHFTSGGAEANMTAALLAATRAQPGFDERGARAFPGAPRLYTSAESHFAWFKIAHQLGAGREAVRLVPTDGHGRMDCGALQEAITDDRAKGRAPFLIAATAGTTNAGMIDPLDACAAVAAREGLWLHVDAAWAGGLLASETHASTLAGIQAADSVTIDAHKLLSVPMGAGMLLTRRPGALQEAFRVAASYMPSADGETDPYLSSTQWSRRFMGLKLFLCLAALGWKGYGRHVERQLELATHLRRRLSEHGFTIENDSPVGVVCFSHSVSSAADLVGAIVAQGRSWISLARFEGRAVARACVTSFRTRCEDADQLVEDLAAVVASETSQADSGP